MFFGKLANFTNISQIQDYRDWFARTERAFADGKPEAKWWGDVKGVVDFAPFTGSRSAATWLCAPMAIGSELCQAWGVPGFSMITLDDLRLRRDTPTRHAGAPQRQTRSCRSSTACARCCCARGTTRPSRGPVDLKWQRTQLTGQVVSPAPGRPVPDLPREGFLIDATSHTLNNLPRMPQPRALPWTLGVRRTQVFDTDAEGNCIIEGLPRLGEQQMLAVEAFRPTPGTGEITAISDLGKQRGDIKPYADLKTDVQPMRSVVFSCEEFRPGRPVRPALPAEPRRSAPARRPTKRRAAAV